MIPMKWNLRILLWSTLPALLSFMLNAIAGMQYWDSDGIMSSLTKNFNHPLACYAGILGIITLMAIIFTAMRLMHVTTEIDHLEKAKASWAKETAKLKTARDKYTELLKEETFTKKQITTMVADFSRRVNTESFAGNGDETMDYLENEVKDSINWDVENISRDALNKYLLVSHYFFGSIALIIS